MSRVYRLVILIVLISFVTSQPLSSDDFKQKVVLDPEHNFRMWWNFNSTHILIQLRMRTSGWIGVGFSELGSMVRADIHVGWVKDGKAFLTDRHGVNRNAYPPLDSEQNAKLIEGRECNGETIITFVRQLAACQRGEDREITRGTTRVIYAFSPRDPVDAFSRTDYHGMENRGTKSLLLLQSIATETPVTDPDAKTFDVVADGKLIPRRKTFYKCLLVKVPELNKTHHVIKAEPLINATYIKNVHHIIISACSKEYDDILKNYYGISGACYSSRIAATRQYCQLDLGGWAVGGEGMVYPDNVGLPIGESGSSRYVQLEIHYDNPLHEEIRDDSGMKFTYTPNLRQHHAGSFVVGLPSSGTQLVVPPNISEFKVYGGCDSSCLGGALKKAGIKSINIFSVLPHSHLAGRKIELRHFRNGREFPPILNDNSYDFDYQQSHKISPERVLRKGDELMSVCTYSSKGKSRPVVGGLGTSQEMCLNFVRYYPRIPLGFCLSAPSDLLNNYVKKIFKISGIRDSAPQKPYIRKTLEDFIVTSSQDKANQSLGDIMSSFPWDKKSVKNLEKSWKDSYKFSFCGGPQPEVPTIRYRAPVPVWAPYRPPPPKTCVAPWNGFQRYKRAGNC